MNIQSPTWLNQGRDEIIIETAPECIWSVLEDSRRLREWMPAVKDTNGQLETLGSTRTCQVSLDGRAGVVVERCVVHKPFHRIGWQLVEDTLGFSKMLKHFAFDFVLIPEGSSKTRVVNSSYFEPRNVLVRIVIALVIRRKFRAIRQTSLSNIKRLAEAVGGKTRAAPVTAQFASDRSCGGG